jgi:predicted metal-dependent phosphoesterase TrpH
MVRRLEAAGHPITWADVTAQVQPGATIGRPHIADALVAAGVVPTRNAAFEHLLHADSPFHVGHYATRPEIAVRLVRAAGGVTVFAHPAASLRGRTVPFEVIDALADAGLDGVEVDHRDHDASARVRLRAFAEGRGLLVTGASDYHGDGRENRLGEHTTDPDVYAELATRAARAAVAAAATQS